MQYYCVVFHGQIVWDLLSIYLVTACQKQDLGGKSQDVAQHKSCYSCFYASFPVYLSRLRPYLLSVCPLFFLT